MRDSPTEATVQFLLLEEDPDPTELEQLTVKLRQRLLELDVEAVDSPLAPEAPPGARGIGAVLGSLLIKLGTPQLLAAVIASIRNWLAGHANRSVKITMGGDTLEMTGVSSEEQDQLVAAWIARHGPA